MSQSCRVVKEPENIDKIAGALQRSNAVNAFLRRFPQLGAPLRLINPAADMVDENVARHVIAHSVLREDRQTAATAALSTLVNSPKLKDVFTIDDKGYVTLQRRGFGLGKTSSHFQMVHINDLLEGRKLAQYVLSSEQKKALLDRKDIWSDLRHDYIRYGGEMSAEDDLFPRVIEGYVDPATKKLVKGDMITAQAGSTRGGSTLSTGGSFTRSRAMNPDGSVRSSTDMVNSGWRYQDPDVALGRKAQEIARRTADAQFAEWLKNQPNILKKGDILGAGAKTGVNPARWGMVGFDAAETPALAGYYAPPEVVKYVRELMATQKPVFKGMTWLVNESRGLIASTDHATTGIQLLGAAGADVGHLIGWAATLGKAQKPTAIYPTAVYHAFKAFFDPNELTRYYATNKDVIDRWAPYLGGLKNSEYFGELLKEDSHSIAMKVPLVKRFAREFETSLDVAKVEYAKALERIHGQDISPEDKEALGSWIRNSTGTLSTNRLGISPRQRDLEATWMFFSPRWTRAIFAMTGGIFKADAGGNEARLAMGGLAAGATGVYLAACAALGQEPDLTPVKNGRINPDFMTIRVGDNRVGIGGGIRAMSRLLADSYESAKNDPTRFISPSFSGNHSNPFLSFWRSRSSPLSGRLIDIWTGSDYQGHPLNDGNEWAKMAYSSVLPFGFQAAFDARGSAWTKFGVMQANGFGLHTAPLTAYQSFNEYLQNIRNADGTQRFPDGAQTVDTKDNNFKTFLQQDPEAKHLQAAVEEARLASSGQTADIQKVLTTRQQRIEAADAQLAQTGDYRKYRQQVSEIRAQARTVMEAMNIDSTPGTADKKTVASWYATYQDPRAVDPITGGINADGLDQLQEAWKQAHPGEYERLIQPSESIGATPTETTYRQERAYITNSGWWDTDQNAWDYLKQVLGSKAIGQKLGIDQYPTIADYLQARQQQLTAQYTAAGRPMPELLASVAVKRDPLDAAFQKVRLRERMQLERSDPELVALLDKWGYESTSLTKYRLAVAAQNNQLG